MFGTISFGDVYQALIVSCAVICIYVYSQELPLAVQFDEWKNKGTITDPCEYVAFPPYKKAYDWDFKPATAHKISRAQQHMKHRSKGQFVMAAQEYCLNLRLYYIVDMDLFILNPVIKRQSKARYHADVPIGSNALRVNCPEEMEIEYYDMYEMVYTKKFTKSHACFLFGYMTLL